MKRTRTARMALMMMLVVILTMAMSVTAFASREEADAFIVSKVSFAADGTPRVAEGLRPYVSAIPSGSADTPPANRTRSVSGISGGTVWYDPADEDTISNLATAAASSRDAYDKVQDMTGGFSVQADVGGAAQMLSGFQPLIAVLTGVICFVVVVGMGLFTAFDVAYIAFPVFRNKCEDAKATGGNNFMTKPGKGGNTAESELRWVTNEAQHAVQQATIESGKSPWGIYLKKRCIAYIGLAIILFILMTGRIEIIVNIALNVIGGIMDQLTALGS